GKIPEVVSIYASFGKGGAVSGSQHRCPLVLNQGQLALENEDELVFVAEPVPLTGPLFRRQSNQVDAEIAEQSGVTEALTGTAATSVVEGLGITGAHTNRYGRNVDLGHGDFLKAGFEVTSATYGLCCLRAFASSRPTPAKSFSLQFR